MLSHPWMQGAGALKVFISYGFADYGAVEKMSLALPWKHEVYYFQPNQDVGLPVPESILQRIDWADVVIAYITPATIDRAMAVGNEIGYAKKAGKFIIPLKSKEVQASDLGVLGTLKWIEVDKENPETAYKALADTIWDYALTKELKKRKELNGLLSVLGGLLLLSLFSGGDYEDDY